MIKIKYKLEILKYGLISGLTFLSDYGVYLLAFSITNSIAISTIFGRIIALIIQFLGNKNFVFQNNFNAIVQFVRYLLLVIISGSVSILLNSLLIHILPYYFAKLLAEIFIFIVNFFVMRLFVFKKKESEQKTTDWEAYYKEQPPQIILRGRKRNENLLVSIIKHTKIKNAAEFGGANSKIAERFSHEFNLKEMLIVDSNKYGLKITKENDIKNLKTLYANVFDIDIKNKYDLVYSIGLIEHFSEEGTRDCIIKHIEATRKGGYVLLAFPTPTLQYQILRFGFEVFGLWRFFDERPLKLEEVIKVLEPYGEIEKVTINYKMLMTQGIILLKKTNS